MIAVENTARRMVEKATRIFKQYYGAYPERIGLDYFTRYQEYPQQYWESYTFNALASPLPTNLDGNTMLSYERITIKIDPAVFEPLTRSPLTGLVQQSERGKHEVLCECDGKQVYMTIWFNEQGEHAIIWD
jgi:hypothetical protein